MPSYLDLFMSPHLTEHTLCARGLGDQVDLVGVVKNQDVMVLLLPLLVELLHVAVVPLNHRLEVQRVCGGDADALLDDRDGTGGKFQYVSET